MKIGIAGTGRMGAAVASRLASLGHEIMVWNRTPDKARAVAASAGMKIAATPKELAAASEAVISFLTDAAAVQRVYDQLLEADVKGKLFIEMSTVRPQGQKNLNEKEKKKGGRLVECPVGGTIGPAR